MGIMDERYFGNTVQEWIFSLGVVLLGAAVLQIVKRGLVSRVTKFAEKTATELDDLFADLLKRTRFFFLIALSLYIGSFFLRLSVQSERILQSVVIAATLVQCALWGNTIISFWLSRTLQRRVQKDASIATTLSTLGFISRLMLWTIILLLALDNFGINITALVAGLGIGGIAVALALQNILGDLFASLSIVLDKPFVIGDFIIIDEYMGTVEYIGLKTTRIRSLSGEQIVFSNSDLLKSRIRNYKRMFERRVVFTIGVTHQTPYDKVSQIPTLIREIIESHSLTRFDRAHFKEYGDVALLYEAVYFVESPDYNAYMDIQQSINLALFKRFEELKIDFAHPMQTVILHRAPDNRSAKPTGQERNL